MKGRPSKNLRLTLAEAHRVDEAQAIRNKAVAVVAYARQARDRDLMTWASEIKLRAERRSGELLRELPKHPGSPGPGRGRKTHSNGKRGFSSKGMKTLAELGVSHQQSSDWQQLADLPDEEFEISNPKTLLPKPPGKT